MRPTRWAYRKRPLPASDRLLLEGHLPLLPTIPCPGPLSVEFGFFFEPFIGKAVVTSLTSYRAVFGSEKSVPAY